MILLKQIAVFFLVSILLAAGAVTRATAQSADDVDEEDADHPPSELLKMLATTPASKMDLGLLAAEVKLFAYFAVNKPDVLKKDRLRFLAADYLDLDGSIHVQLSHLSPNNSPDDLASECRQDVDLAREAFVPRFGRTEAFKPANASEEALMCRAVTSMFFGVETTAQFLSREMRQPDDNLCRHIRFYARVSSMEEDVNVHCFKDFFSPDIEVTHEQNE
jgi:hypothetical protein